MDGRHAALFEDLIGARNENERAAKEAGDRMSVFTELFPFLQGPEYHEAMIASMQAAARVNELEELDSLNKDLAERDKQNLENFINSLDTQLPVMQAYLKDNPGALNETLNLDLNKDRLVDTLELITQGKVSDNEFYLRDTDGDRMKDIEEAKDNFSDSTIGYDARDSKTSSFQMGTDKVAEAMTDGELITGYSRAINDVYVNCAATMLKVYEKAAEKIVEERMKDEELSKELNNLTVVQADIDSGKVLAREDITPVTKEELEDALDAVMVEYLGENYRNYLDNRDFQISEEELNTLFPESPGVTTEDFDSSLNNLEPPMDLENDIQQIYPDEEFDMDEFDRMVADYNRYNEELNNELDEINPNWREDLFRETE